MISIPIVKSAPLSIIFLSRRRRRRPLSPFFLLLPRCANKMWVCLCEPSFFLSCVCLCVCFCVLYWMDSIYNWMLSSLTIILPSMTTFFCTAAAAALNDYYLLFCLFYVSQFFLSCFYHPVLLFMLFLPGFTSFFLVCHCSRSVLYCFPTFFLLFPCVWFLFFVCFFFLCVTV